MLRCEDSAGVYRVSLIVLHEKDPYRVQILGHHDIDFEKDGVKFFELAPWVGTTEPFEGELCTHEYQWLNGVPGKEYPRYWEFRVEKR